MVEGFRCRVCGAEVDVSTAHPWRCPNATALIDTTSSTSSAGQGRSRAAEDPDPLVAYGGELAWQSFALANGMTVDAAHALVRQLDARVATVDGTGFRDDAVRPGRQAVRRPRVRLPTVACG